MLAAVDFCCTWRGVTTSGEGASASRCLQRKPRGLPWIRGLKRRHIQLSLSIQQPQMGKSLKNRSLRVPQPLLSTSPHCILWHRGQRTEILLQGEAKQPKYRLKQQGGFLVPRDISKQSCPVWVTSLPSQPDRSPAVGKLRPYAAQQELPSHCVCWETPVFVAVLLAAQ